MADHHNKRYNNEKLRILEELTKWDTDTQREQMPFEKRYQYWATSIAQISLFVKNKVTVKYKHDEVTVKMKQCMPLKAKWKTALIQGMR